MEGHPYFVANPIHIVYHMIPKCPKIDFHREHGTCVCTRYFILENTPESIVGDLEYFHLRSRETKETRA